MGYFEWHFKTDEDKPLLVGLYFSSTKSFDENDARFVLDSIRKAKEFKDMGDTAIKAFKYKLTFELKGIEAKYTLKGSLGDILTKEGRLDLRQVLCSAFNKALVEWSEKGG